jgi:pyruvate formate-lyase activating enzyme-like uncharacterized protein
MLLTTQFATVRVGLTPGQRLCFTSTKLLVLMVQKYLNRQCATCQGKLSDGQQLFEGFRV